MFPDPMVSYNRFKGVSVLDRNLNQISRGGLHEVSFHQAANETPPHFVLERTQWCPLTSETLKKDHLPLKRCKAYKTSQKS